MFRNVLLVYDKTARCRSSLIVQRCASKQTGKEIQIKPEPREADIVYTSDKPTKLAQVPTHNVPADFNQKPFPQKLIKTIPVEHHGVLPTEFSDEFIWVPIYRYPLLHMGRRITRFKQAFSAFAISSVAYLSYIHVVEGVGSAFKLALLGVTGVAAMVFTGNYSRKLIGQAYISADQKYARLARLSFFGKRRDVVVPVGYIMPLSETNRHKNQFFLAIELIAPKHIDPDNDNVEFYEEKFYISIAYGGIVDEVAFRKIFGHIIYRKTL